MKSKKLFIVSDWKSYAVAEACNHRGALEKVYPSKNYRLIPSNELTEQSVTHAMTCEYNRKNMSRFNSCSDETNIVLLMNELNETQHYVLSDDFFA